MYKWNPESDPNIKESANTLPLVAINKDNLLKKNRLDLLNIIVEAKRKWEINMTKKGRYNPFQ